MHTICSNHSDGCFVIVIYLLSYIRVYQSFCSGYIRGDYAAVYRATSPNRGYFRDAIRNVPVYVLLVVLPPISLRSSR